MSGQLRFRPQAVGQYFDGPLGGKLVREVHASTCAHCQTVTEFPNYRTMMEHVDICRGCMKLICLGCCGKPCRPFEQEAERQEREARLRRRLQTNAWGCYPA